MKNLKNSYLDKIKNCIQVLNYKAIFSNNNRNIIYLSKSCFELTGYQPEEILDNKGYFDSLVEDKDKAKIVNKLEIAVKNHKPYSLEYRIRDKDNKKKLVCDQGIPIYENNGKLKYLAGQIMDITETSQKLEEIYRINEIKERYELAIQSAVLGLWDWNIKTDHVLFNKQWADMLGYELEEIEPRVDKWYNMIHPDDKERVSQVLKKHLRGEISIYQIDHRLKTKSGKYKWVRDIGKVLKRDKNGDPVRAVGIHIDIDQGKKAEQEIRQQEEKFRTYIEHAPIGVFVANDQAKFLDVNKKAEQISGYSEEELKKLTFHDLSVRNDREINILFKKFKRNKRIEIKGRFKKKNGIKINAKINAVVINNNKYLGFVENIDKEIKMENRIKRQKAYFEQLFNESTTGIVLLNNKGIVLKANDKFLEIFNYSLKEVVGINIDNLITPPQKKDEGIYFTEKVIEGEDVKEESVRMTRDGKLIDVSVHAFPIKLDEGQIGIYGIYNDISERKKQEQKRIKLTFHDQLTELYNRRYFENELDRLDTSRKIPISIIMSDMDNLKEINDTFGHTAGDQKIKDIGDILLSVMRKEDVVARIGGDEFAILLPRTDIENTKNIVKRIKKEIVKYNKVENISVSISIGFAAKTKKNQNLKEVLKEADRIMYQNKRKKEK
ncbi:MAG: PAS domain S-box protein [Halanaerobiales bacterium]|nr:PAS domain S-box protein [Halanaerobiales bacterium]